VAKIVELGSRIHRNKPDVWRCNCGSHTFWLYSDRAVVCSECEQEAIEMTGSWHSPSLEFA
jgi:hypothetical protein